MHGICITHKTHTQNSITHRREIGFVCLAGLSSTFPQFGSYTLRRSYFQIWFSPYGTAPALLLLLLLFLLLLGTLVFPLLLFLEMSVLLLSLLLMLRLMILPLLLFIVNVVTPASMNEMLL